MKLITKTANRIYGNGINIVRIFHSNKAYPFEVPIAIERSQIELLQALSKTIKHDETAPNFAFIDDPFTIPTNAVQRKKYLLSKEFGKRTAQRFVEEWPTLFKFDRDQPQLAPFRRAKAPDPKNFGLEEINLALKNLEKMIENRQINDAIELFNKIKEQEIPSNIKMNLFRLLCYYNENEMPITEFEWPANRIYGTGMEKPAIEYSPWSGNFNKPALAEELFEELPKNDETYSLLICGLLKFPTNYSLIKAVELYQQMIKEGHVPFEEVFNFMIRMKRPLKSDSFDLHEWLEEMEKFQILPSIRIFNSCFDALSNETTQDEKIENQMVDSNNAERSIDEEQLKLNLNKVNFDQKNGKKFSQDKKSKWKSALTLINEMNRFGIEQSLTIYWKILDLSANDIKIRVNILNEIFCRLEQKLKNGEKIMFTDQEDHIFFYTCLGVIALAQNENLLDRLIYIYRHELNRVKIQNPWDETIFYQNYLIPKLYSMPLDAFFILYKQHIPNLASISGFFIGTILNEIRFRKQEFSWQLLKRVVEDCISGLIIEKDSFAVTILRQLRYIRPTLDLSEPDSKEYFALCERLISIIEQLQQLRDDRQQKFNEQ